MKKQTTTTIFELVNSWGQEGYGIALINPDDEVVEPYIDPSDYPDIILDSNRTGANVIEGKYKNYYIIFHSGQLEEKIGKEWLRRCGESFEYPRCGK